MSNFEDYNTPGGSMRPQPGRNVIELPVTIEANSGRSGDTNTRFAGAAVGIVIWALISFGELTGSDPWGAKLWKLVIFTVVVMVIIRFVFLQEYKYRRTYSILQQKKNQFDLSNIWGIVSVDEDEPHFVHFRNGGIGLFAAMENDVVVGKPDDDEFQSYQALGDAYNRAHDYELKMVHVDNMDFIGEDGRLDYARQTMAEQCDNPEIRSLMTSIFDNLQRRMNDNVTTSDVYVFSTSNMTSDVFRYNTKQVLDIMCRGNYASYHFMIQAEIGTLVKSLFNLGNFSVVNALVTSYKTENIKGIKVLDANFDDGTSEVYLKPWDIRKAEKKEQQRSAAQRQQLTKRENERRKHARKTGQPPVMPDNDSLEL